MNLKLLTLAMIFLAISVQHAYAKKKPVTCKGSWFQAQNNPMCQTGTIGILKRTMDTGNDDEGVQETSFADEEVNVDENDQISDEDYFELLLDQISDEEYYELLLEVFGDIESEP